MTHCTYEIAYHGECGEPSTSVIDYGKHRCDKHVSERCVACNRTATRQCSMDGTLGVCGSPICDACKHDGYGHRKNDDRTIYKESPMPTPDPDDLDQQMTPAVGDWVRVWAVVTKTSDMPGVHPEDMLLRLESHNADYPAHVRNDHIEFDGTSPSFARTCTALYEIEAKVKVLGTKGRVEAWVRCEKPQGHEGIHQHSATEAGGAYQWGKADVYLEDNR